MDNKNKATTSPATKQTPSIAAPIIIPNPVGKSPSFIINPPSECYYATTIARIIATIKAYIPIASHKAPIKIILVKIGPLASGLRPRDCMAE
jgi:hypothetical protein